MPQKKTTSHRKKITSPRGKNQAVRKKRQIIKTPPLENIFNVIPMPVFVKDRSHRWVIFNDALCHLQGKKRDELQDKNDYDFFPKMQADQFWKEEETVFKTRKELFNEEPSLRNGTESYVLIKKTVVTTDHGEDYLVGCCIDITERKKAELALVESERRFRSLVQYSPDIITILEKDYTIRYITPSFFRTFDLNETEVIGHSILEFIHHEDIPHVEARIQYILQAPETRTSLECRFKKKDGEWLILESMFNNLLAEPAVGGIVINSSDITEFRNQADEIQRMNKLLEKDNKKLKVDLKNEAKARINLKAVNFKEFKKIYPDDSACLQYVSGLKWKNDYACRKCGNAKSCKGKFPYSRRCTICGYDESATANTIFYRLKFPIIKAFYMVFLINSQRKITAKNLSALISLRKETCSVFKRKLLSVLKYKKNSNKLIQGWEGLLLAPAKKNDK